MAWINISLMVVARVRKWHWGCNGSGLRPRFIDAGLLSSLGQIVWTRNINCLAVVMLWYNRSGFSILWWRWFFKQEFSTNSIDYQAWANRASSSGRIFAPAALPWWCWSWCHWCIGKKERYAQCGGLCDWIILFLKGPVIFFMLATY